MAENALNTLVSLIDKIGADNLTPASTELLIKAISEEVDRDADTNIPSSDKKVSKKVGMVTRPLEKDEFEKIIYLLNNGFQYTDEDDKKHTFRPQPNVALAVSLEATLGLRISDILRLKVKNFKKNRLELLEKKTNKLQYREIDPQVSEYIRDYALSNNLGLDDYLINVKARWIQSRLQIIREYLGLTNISTHSFRKMFAKYIYDKSHGDIDLLKNLLNHSSNSVTEKYLRTSQKKIDEFSKSVNFLNINENTDDTLDMIEGNDTI